jgi:Kef-type K+ transport system membrane component KefB
LLIVDLAVIVVVARLLGALARRVGQPAVIGEILGGILLGPTLFGGAITRALFPSDVRPALSTLATIGVCIFMFGVGLELDRSLLRGQGGIVGTVSLGAIVVPFLFGALLALYLIRHHPTEHRWGFILFLGTAMSVTAFPVLARILTDRGLLHTPIGGLALACAAVDDVLAWSALAVVAALSVDAGPDAWRVLLVVPFAALLLGAVRPLLAWLADRTGASGRIGAAAALVIVAAGLLLSAEATEWMGLHAIFGAFLFGVSMPRRGAAVVRERVLPGIEKVTSILLLPVFFMVAGLRVNLSTVDGIAVAELALILLVAVGGKLGGAFAGARASRVSTRHSAVLAILMNTRGLTELIVLTVGLQFGVLDAGLYSLMVVMALVTTAMTGALLPLVYPADLVRREAVAPSRPGSLLSQSALVRKELAS